MGLTLFILVNMLAVSVSILITGLIFKLFKFILDLFDI